MKAVLHLRRTISRMTVFAFVLLSPTLVWAGGANTKTGIGKDNGRSCPAGFYLDAKAGKCVAANWI